MVRVHPEFLAGQKLPSGLVTKRIWEERYEDINDFERYLARNGTVIRKFFLHVSRKEQKKRFMERLDEPEKNWKFSAADVRERAHWERVHGGLRGHDPRHGHPARPLVRRPGRQQVVHPARGRGGARRAMEGLNLHYPKVDKKKRAELAAARELLMQERD